MNWKTCAVTAKNRLATVVKRWKDQEGGESIL